MKFITKNGLKTFASLTAFLAPLLLKQLMIACLKKYINVGEAVIGYSEGGKIGGFKFHIVERESINMSCDITDHYIDTNRSVQDHIAWKPITITLQTMQGRYFHDISQDVEKNSLYYTALTLVTSLIPKLPTTTLIRKARQSISSVTSKAGGIAGGLLNNAVNTLLSYGIGILKDKLQQVGKDFFGLQEQAVEIKDEQTKAFYYLSTMWELGIPLTVVTTWKTYENMFISNLKPLRDGNGDITEFTIELKQVTSVESIVYDTTKSKDRVEEQKEEPVELGKTNGTEVGIDENGYATDTGYETFESGPWY